MKRKQLKLRILKNIGMALVFASIFSTIAAYTYFNSVVRNQMIHDEEVKLKQMVYQLEFMITDVQNFSKSIAIDPVVQENMVMTEFESEFQRTKKSYEVATKMVFYKSLRNYIGAISLKGYNGENYSSIGFPGKTYFTNKFNLPEILEYEKDKSLIFSRPYEGYENEISQKVISYRTQIHNINKTDEIIGDLYLDIYLDYFLREIRSYATNYEDVFLIGNHQNIIYLKEKDASQINNLILSPNTEQTIMKTKKGYIITQSISNIDWTIGTYISRAYLWNKSKFVLEFFAIFFLISIGVLLVLTSRILDNMIKPITKLTKAMENIHYETLEVDLNIQTNDEIELLSIRFKEMLVQIQRYMHDKIESENQKKEMEFDILLSQINPHYLYNVLNTVVYLATAKKNKEVVEVVNSMIYMLQETLKVGEMNIFTTLETELKLVRSYLKIQGYRYPKVFKTTIDCDRKLYGYMVPKTIIQPIVENALFHGIIPSETYGEITIGIYVEEDNLKIVIEDTGIGMSQEVIRRYLDNETITSSEPIRGEQKHIGIKNIQDRIKYLYGEMYGVSITSKDEGYENKGTKVIIILPCQ